MKLKVSSMLTFVLAMVLVTLPISVVHAQSSNKVCAKSDVFCDDFVGHTFFKDQNSSASWNKYLFDRDNAVDYINNNAEKFLRLNINDNASTNFYTDANISTSEINNPNGQFRFGVNTRAEVRMRYSPNITADNSGSAVGSGGFLFWNYFYDNADPETKNLQRVRDAFGFVWQDEASFPTPGFWLTAVGSGMPGVYEPYFNIDLSEFHTYALERTHFEMRYYIDDVLVKTQLLNQEGGVPLPDDSLLSTDMWVDNASYVLDFATFNIDIVFNDIVENQYADIDYVRVTSL